MLSLFIYLIKTVHKVAVMSQQCSVMSHVSDIVEGSDVIVQLK